MSLFRFLILVFAFSSLVLSSMPASAWSCVGVPEKGVLHYLLKNDVIFTGSHLSTIWEDEADNNAVTKYSVNTLYKGLLPWQNIVEIRHKTYSLEEYPGSRTLRSPPVGLLLVHANKENGLLIYKEPHPCSYSYKFSNQIRFFALSTYRYKWIPLSLLLLLSFCAYRVGGIKNLITKDLGFVFKKTCLGRKYSKQSENKKHPSKFSKFLYILLLILFLSTFVISNLDSKMLGHILFTLKYKIF